MNGLRKILTTCLLMLLGCSMAMAIELTPVTTGHLPVSDPGTLKRYTAFCGALNASYTVDIWFPEGYDAGSETRYPVIYMQDGQNLFDPSISFAKVAWEVDKALGRLIAAGEVTAPIIVGIHNRGVDRPADYIPEKPITEYMNKHQQTLSGMDAVTGGKYYGDEYAAFVATELKPAVDALFPTIPDREHTFIMGSSMGALASLTQCANTPTFMAAQDVCRRIGSATSTPTAQFSQRQCSIICRLRCRVPHRTNCILTEAPRASTPIMRSGRTKPWNLLRARDIASRPVHCMSMLHREQTITNISGNSGLTRRLSSFCTISARTYRP